MGKKLYCGNLSYGVRNPELEELFTQFGTVESAQVIEDRETGRSKGFGFVEMESREGGQRALDEMNGKEYMGFRMVVKEAEERGSRPPRPGGGPGGSAGRPAGASPSRGGFTPRSGGSGGPGGGSGGFSSPDKKPAAKKKKVSRNKPDKYSDGPRQTKMKKPKSGGGAQNWTDFDDDY